jgi:hypothetical protein
LNHKLELFPIKQDDFMNVVSSFHLPCVRGYYDGNDVYMTTSCVIAHMTLMNIDYKYFTGTKDSYDIILKQSNNDITYINYLTFLTQQLQTNTFSYTLMPSPFELGKYYKFSIRAKSGPVASIYVESQTVYAPYLPGVPTPSDSDTNGSLYQIYWNASSGPNEGTPTNYSVQIYRNTGSYTLETTIFTLTNQTDYEYSVSITGYYKFSVAAVNESGQSAYSALAGERYVTYTPGL